MSVFFVVFVVLELTQTTVRRQLYRNGRFVVASTTAPI
jgi:hypothetical protein